VPALRAESLKKSLKKALVTSRKWTAAGEPANSISVSTHHRDGQLQKWFTANWKKASAQPQWRLPGRCKDILKRALEQEVKWH
jgi:hypothetical protein